MVTRLRRSTSSAPGSFNPETDITWHSLFWAEGTDFVALSISDGGSVTTIPNETGESDFAVETSNGVLRSTYANLNNQPVIQRNANNTHFGTGLFSVKPSSPASVVLIGDFNDDSSKTAIDGYSATHRVLIGSLTATPKKWRIRQSTNLAESTGTIAAGGHLAAGYFTTVADSDALYVDGAQVALGSAGGGSAGAPDGLDLFGDYTGAGWGFLEAVALVGVYEGDVTADGSWSDFETWVSDHYGITIA